MTIHELKTHTKYFQAVCYGGKNFEVRKNDRNYKVKDLLHLKNYCPIKKEYGFGYVIAEVEYILQGGNFGIEEGFVVMGLKILTKDY